MKMTYAAAQNNSRTSASAAAGPSDDAQNKRLAKCNVCRTTVKDLDVTDLIWICRKDF